ncbi:MAG: hypothetical protein ACLFQK_12100 [Fibrobacterota bacterium]
MTYKDARNDLFIIRLMIGGIDHGYWCKEDPSVTVKGNADLNWYFNKSGNSWNYRDLSFPTPFAFFSNGDNDAPDHQGDNLQQAMEESRRGYQYHRFSGGHSDNSAMRRDWLGKFRKKQSFLAFTNKSYRLGSFSSTGYFLSLEVHRWAPSTIIDETNHYYVELTGTGTADEYGLVTVPQVPYSLTTASPNPFHPNTTVKIRLDEKSRKNGLKLKIFDIKGTLIKEFSAPKGHKKEILRFEWDASKNPSGTHIAKIDLGRTNYFKRISLIK